MAAETRVDMLPHFFPSFVWKGFPSKKINYPTKTWCPLWTHGHCGSGCFWVRLMFIRNVLNCAYHFQRMVACFILPAETKRKPLFDVSRTTRSITLLTPGAGLVFLNSLPEFMDFGHFLAWTSLVAYKSLVSFLGAIHSIGSENIDQQTPHDPMTP